MEPANPRPADWAGVDDPADRWLGARPPGQHGELGEAHPSSTGSYIAGTWSSVAPTPAGYTPLYYALAVLPDGRVIVEGGEYNGSGTQVETNLGAIYDPVANSWTSVSPPSGWSSIGDAQSVVLPNGTFMLANCCTTQEARLNASTLTWNSTGSGKADVNDEEGWTLTPFNVVFTVDASNGTNSESYNPGTGSWSSNGSTVSSLVDADHELGPQTWSPAGPGSLLAVGATGATSVFTTGWSAAASLPVIGGQQYDTADGPAATLPNGKILVSASPGDFNAPTHFFLYDFATNTFTQIADTPDAPSDSSYFLRMLVLPTGQVMEDDGSQVQIYTPSGSASSAWKPSISSVPSTLAPSSTYSLSGHQLNGRDQGAAYGDDFQDNTSYPFVQITNTPTKTVTYARTTGMSNMSITAGNASTTNLQVSSKALPGLSSLTVVANGIASDPVSVDVPVLVLDSRFSPTSAKLLLGETLTWLLPSSDTGSHTVTDNSGMGLFDSGTLAPGSTFSFPFAGAGTYPVIDSMTSHTSKVTIAPTVSPKSGTTSTTFTIKMASSVLSFPYVEDVFVKRPGTTSFALLTTSAATSITFTPDAGTGTYTFETQLRNRSNGNHTAVSPTVSINAS